MPASRPLMALRRPLVIVLHLGLIWLANAAAFWLRFEGDVPAWAQELQYRTLLLLLLVRAGTFVPLRLYEGLWRYTSLWDLRNIVLGVTVSSGVFALLVQAVTSVRYPRSVYVVDALLLVCLMSGVRLSRRVYAEARGKGQGKRVLVYGAGDAGETIVREMKTQGQHNYHPVGFIDDDRGKVGRRIHGVLVLGTRRDVPRIMARAKPDEILLAIPQVTQDALRRVVRAFDPYAVPIKTLPHLRDVLEGRVEVGHIRDLSVKDLLGRGTVGLDPAPIRNFLRGRRVLVTGAGGSIGWELCRQIAQLEAASIVLFERHENSLFHVTNDLTDRGHGDIIHPVIGDVTDEPRLDDVLTRFRPEVLFHAAAHKHVPLMEDNPCEAVKNNVEGTRLLARAAERHGVDRFILISTDKAVNPTNVMGATKRVGELLVLTQGKGSGTSFMVVRFGNVLASSGSVVPRFLQQIRAGGPVTVTHPDMRRYFMLIPEAVQLVLHAGAQGRNGKLFVLEMGEQVKLVDMARDLIRLAGFVPDQDVKITFTGPRPGEKLFEELVAPDEVAEVSGTEKLLRVRPLALPDPFQLATQIHELEALARSGRTDAVVAQIGRIVPAFGLHRNQETPAAAFSPMMAAVQAEPAEPADGARATAGTQRPCPSCRGQAMHRSHLRRSERLFVQLTAKRPYRCQACKWRGWLLPWSQPHSGPVADFHELLPPDLQALDNTLSTPVATARPIFASRDLRDE